MAIKDRTNWQQVDRSFRQAREEYDRKAVEWLSTLGERVVKYAREHGNYTDRTGNLRHSIGYVVVQGGRIVKSEFAPGPAQNESRAYAIEVALRLPPHKTCLVWVAGMRYAHYVEAKGFDVLQGSADWVEATAERLKAEFGQYLRSQQR